MSSPSELKITEEQAREMPMVDLAFLILKSANKPFYYRDLMQEIAKVKGLSESEVMDIIAQVYTEINIDGRFACVGNSVWGLKRWYPVDKSEDVAGGNFPRIINDDDDLDDEDVFGEEEVYEADAEVDFDAVIDDEDDVFIDVDEADDLEDESDDVEDDLVDEDEELDEEFVDEDVEEFDR